MFLIVFLLSTINKLIIIIIIIINVKKSDPKLLPEAKQSVTGTTKNQIKNTNEQSRANWKLGRKWYW